MGRRVVVTGLGMITPLGHDLSATVAALAAGHTAVGPATRSDSSAFARDSAAEIAGWDPRAVFRLPKALKLTDRPARFAVASAQMALHAAGYPRDPRALDGLGVAIGASGSDLQARELVRALAGDRTAWCVDDIHAFGERVLGHLNPLWLLVSLPNMTSAHVAIQLEARGPNTTIMSDWVAGHAAIAEAALWIEMNEADAVLAGGADCALQPFALAAFEQAGLLRCDDHCGLVPAEGAAVLLLEAGEAASARGARPWGEFRGCAMRAPSGDDPACALRDALADVLSIAGWSSCDVAVCGVTRPATGAHDRVAREAIDAVFDRRLTPVSFCGELGFALAAAPPIDLALILSAHPAARVVSSCVGSSGEAAALAFEADARGFRCRER
jgi:3-oxoacyl-(acyl-carrier-protein) synthase